jgi:urease accessory protein UreE
LIPTLETPYETATLQEWERQTERIGISINHDKFLKIRLQEEEALGKEAITLQELAKRIRTKAGGCGSTDCITLQSNY